MLLRDNINTQVLKTIVLKSDYIQVDESTIPVISNEKHKAQKAYLWMVRSVMNNLVFFHYDKGSRAQKVILPLLKDFQGAIQTDGYQAYSIYEQKKGVLLLGCWAHARRKFSESLKEDKTGAEYALFCGNHDAAENAAIMYSLLGCCKASDVNPREWLTDVFSKIALYNSNYDLDLADLLPHNWKKSNSCQNIPKNTH